MLFTPGSYKEGRAYVLDDFPGMSCGARQQRPESHGQVRLVSADPQAAPIVQPNYLSDARGRCLGDAAGAVSQHACGDADGGGESSRVDTQRDRFSVSQLTAK